MRLGVVMTGVGAHAAASVGVMQALAQRGIAPHAVCAMGMGALPAAWFAAGMEMADMEKALHQAAGMGRRMMARTACERMARKSMPEGERLNHLLGVQTGRRVLSLCPGAALFPCRMARSGQRVLFSTRPFMQEQEAVLAMQASVAFAARACMALPPFLAPVQYMGSPLLGETDSGFCARQLLLMGAQRVLIVEPQPSPQRVQDALDLAGTALRLSDGKLPEEAVAVLRVRMPDTVGALSLSQLAMCSRAGQMAAERELDALFERMGMAFCRVLPFRRQMG